MNIQVFFFALLAVLAIASAIGTVASRHPVASAMSLIFHFFMLAGIYLTLQAQFIAVIQILVYAGAIMVLVVFVIMLLNLGSEEILRERSNFRRVFSIVLSSALLILIISSIFGKAPAIDNISAKALQNSTVEAIGTELFTKYLLPFEAVSLLLLAAIIGAVVLAKRKVEF